MHLVTCTAEGEKHVGTAAVLQELLFLFRGIFLGTLESRSLLWRNRTDSQLI